MREMRQRDGVICSSICRWPVIKLIFDPEKTDSGLLIITYMALKAPSKFLFKGPVRSKCKVLMSVGRAAWLHVNGTKSMWLTGPQNSSKRVWGRKLRLLLENISGVKFPVCERSLEGPAPCSQGLAYMLLGGRHRLHLAAIPWAHSQCHMTTWFCSQGPRMQSDSKKGSMLVMSREKEKWTQ